MIDGWSAPVDEASDDEMARKAKKASLPPDESRVGTYEARLKSARLDRGEFESALDTIKADKSLTVADVTEIAVRYRGGGERPSSKKSALEIISKRFLELVRNQAQIKQASKARPW